MKDVNNENKDLKYTVRGIPDGKALDLLVSDVDHSTKKFTKKNAKLMAERKAASKLVSMANKRLRRLEQNGLTDTPAYKGYIANGGKPFSVRGKSHNELQAELARLRGFINAETSTIRGTNNYLKEMAKNTGIKYKNLTDLRAKAHKFFELASKTEQYLRNVEDMASAIDYNQIWESINVYVQSHKVDLAAADNDIDRMIREVTNALKEYDKPVVGAGITFRLKK